MEIEVQLDRSAERRHRRGIWVSLAAFGLFLPAVILVLLLLGAVMGRERVRPYEGAVFTVGFVALVAIQFHGTRDSIAYRCPRCGRRLPKVDPEGGDARPNLHYGCEDCRVVWDLGWGWGEPA